MRRLLVLLLVLLLPGPALGGFTLADGILTIRAEASPGWFVVAPANNDGQALYHDFDGRGIQLTFFPPGSFSEVVFVGGPSFDVCWVQIEGLTCTFTINNDDNQDLVLGSPAGNNEFFVDNMDVVFANRTDTIHGTPLMVVYY